MLVATGVRKIANKDKWVGGYELDLSLLALALIIALYGRANGLYEKENKSYKNDNSISPVAILIAIIFTVSFFFL